jgi:magnesium and cobalt exporter, CNNM family
VNSTILNICLVAFFVLLGGVFAAAEIALVSLREGQIKALAKRGKRGRAVARLAEDPNRFLSAVQIGVTLCGFLSAAFGAATIADDFAPVLVDLGLPDGASDVIALVVITLVIAYFSIVLSELTAKRIALQRSVGVALAFGPAIDRMARLSTPIIWLLSRSTDVAVRALGGDPRAAREEISDEELRHLVSSHETLSDEERQIVEDVFAAGDHQIREVMIPRTEVDFLDASVPVFKALKFAAERPHSRYPVIRSSADDIVGFIHVRDLFDPELNGRSLRVGDLARDTLLIPGTREVLAALTDMRREGVHLAIVADEYGGTDGIVTLEDLVEELVGDIRDEYDVDERHVLRLVSGDMEVEGLLNLDDFRDVTGLELPDGPYETVAGYIVARLGHVPEIGESAAFNGHMLTVVGVDGRRVSRVRVSIRPEVTLQVESADAEADADAGADPGPAAQSG